MSLVQMAIAFATQHPAVTAAIIGPRTMEHLESQLDAADVTLSDEILDQIDEIVPPGVTINPADNMSFGPALTPAARRDVPNGYAQARGGTCHTGTRSSRNGRVAPGGEDLGFVSYRTRFAGSRPRFCFEDLAQITFESEKAVARAAQSASCESTPLFSGCKYTIMVSPGRHSRAPGSSWFGASALIAEAYMSLSLARCEPAAHSGAGDRGEASGRPLARFWVQMFPLRHRWLAGGGPTRTGGSSVRIGSSGRYRASLNSIG